MLSVSQSVYSSGCAPCQLHRIFTLRSCLFSPMPTAVQVQCLRVPASTLQLIIINASRTYSDSERHRLVRNQKLLLMEVFR